jgi:hypothetical protein
MADRLSASVVLMILGVASQPVLSWTRTLASASSSPGVIDQSSQGTPNAGNAIIAGVVVNERQEPVARALVLAFPAGRTVPQGQTPPLKRANGSASTDPEGRFQISGLELGEYVVAAAPAALLPSGGSTQPAIYATTFYPSTIDNQQVVRVSSVAAAPRRFRSNSCGFQVRACQGPW